MFRLYLLIVKRASSLTISLPSIYTAAGYADHSGTPDDTVNFNLLLDDVRAALDELGKQTGRF